MPPLTYWVVVLGDFGRSPRMQYHTLSLSQKPGTTVHVLAYKGSAPLPELQAASNVHLCYVPQFPKLLQRLPRIIALALKALQLFLALLWLMLVTLPSPAAIIMQNPPAVPTMAVCWLASKLRRARLVIDWHNYGYTIMALSPGSRHLVPLARKYEHFWGRKAVQHFCVSKAMQDDLSVNWGIRTTVLYDRPPARFQRTPVAAVHDLFCKLASSLKQQDFQDYLSVQLRQQARAGGSVSSDSFVTIPGTGGRPVQWAPERPALVISSTSWTPDEDFGVLWDAAVEYDHMAALPNAQLPKILFLITGRGPMQAAYIERLKATKFSSVAFRLLWLEAADYPLLLGAADLGVCLHTSSSGLDLPMKVVDMFGSGLPVLAMRYKCITELVSEGKTGLLFDSAQQLAQQLGRVLNGFPAQLSPDLQHMAQQVANKEQRWRWDDNWNKVAWPRIQGSPNPSKQD